MHFYVFFDGRNYKTHHEFKFDIWYTKSVNNHEFDIWYTKIAKTNHELDIWYTNMSILSDLFAKKFELVRNMSNSVRIW
jgi:hypothetical protein